MNKYLLSIALLLLLPLMAFGANLTAEQVLDKTAEKFKTAPSISLSFSATSGDGQTIKGKFIMAQDKFTITAPGMGVWFDGMDMYSYTDQTGEACITTPTLSELMESNPFYIISGYSTEYNAKTLSSNNGTYVIQLSPKTKNASIGKAVITIDASTWNPTSIEMTFVNSATMKVTISSVQQSSSTPAISTFLFPAASFPNAEIVDLR